MIYKFKSQADADVIMLESSGDQMLTIIGRQPSAQGVVTVAQIPAAIAALEAAIISHEAAQSHMAAIPSSELAADGDARGRANRVAMLVRLKTAKKEETRARLVQCFIEMLEKGERIH